VSVWGMVCHMASIAVFVVGGFVGGAIAWFIRGVKADVQIEDELGDHRVRAQQLSDKWQ
jgi:hypothetical protein